MRTICSYFPLPGENVGPQCHQRTLVSRRRKRLNPPLLDLRRSPPNPRARLGGGWGACLTDFQPLLLLVPALAIHRRQQEGADVTVVQANARDLPAIIDAKRLLKRPVRTCRN
jgi:hypothetical protein